MREQVQGKSRYGLPWVEPAKIGRPRWIHKNPVVADQAEEIYEPLRDVLITTPSYAFGSQKAFSIPVGGSYTPMGAATPYQKTRWDTNLIRAAELPNPEKFQIEGIAVQLHPSTHPTDAAAWAAQMLITLTIGGDDKKYVEMQPIFLGGAGGLFSSGQIFQTSAANFDAHLLSNGWPTCRNLHVLGEDLASGAQIIEQGQNFGLTEDPSQDKYDAAYTTVADTAVWPLGRGIEAFYQLVGHRLRGVQ
jgi:hypothetical protein